MDNFLLFVIAVLFILLAGLLIFYFQTQQSFREISEQLASMQGPAPISHSTESLRRELASHHDKLVLLEADITKNKREFLVEDELKTFDIARQQIKASIAGLKASGEWIGLPFEYEWNEMLERLPNVLSLYRKAEADKQSQEIAVATGT